LNDEVTRQIAKLLNARSNPTVRDLVEVVEAVADHLERSAPPRSADVVADGIADAVLDVLNTRPNTATKSELVALIAAEIEKSEAQWEQLFKELLHAKLRIAPDEPMTKRGSVHGNGVRYWEVKDLT
jgi:hypothetical protein